jgi:hypothetical protein
LRRLRRADRGALSALDGVERRGSNLSSRRVGGDLALAEPPPLGAALDALGFEAHLPSGETPQATRRSRGCCARWPWPASRR